MPIDESSRATFVIGFPCAGHDLFSRQSDPVKPWVGDAGFLGPDLEGERAVPFSAEEFAATPARHRAHITTIAAGTKVRDLPRLRKLYGRGRWRKLKGMALVEQPSGRLAQAELHWYEAHGIGRVEMKIKRLLD